MLVILQFQGDHFIEAPLESRVRVHLSGEKGGDGGASDLGADDPGAEADYVHVVVLDALCGGVGVVRGRRPKRHVALSRCQIIPDKGHSLQVAHYAQLNATRMHELNIARIEGDII